MSDVLFFWTPVAIMTAVLSGLAFAVVREHLLPGHYAWRFAAMVALAGTFYYLPLMVQRVFDSALVSNGLRTVGTYGLFLLFCVSLGVTSSLISRKP